MAPRNIALPGVFLNALLGLNIPAAFRNPKPQAGAGLTPPDPDSALLDTRQAHTTAQRQVEKAMRDYTQRVNRFRMQ